MVSALEQLVGATPLVRVEGLKKHFTKGRQTLKAVDGITFDIRRGECLGLVGESGSGKSTAARAILRLHEPTAGKVTFDGQDFLKMDGPQLREMRRQMQIVFQDPFSSLVPHWSAGANIIEPLRVHKIGTQKEREEEVLRLMELVGLNTKAIGTFPHEFSGGQQQRIGIARALALKPKFLVCDEPVSALDVSIQAQILNLLQSLQEELGLTYLFIAHNLGVVEHISHRVAVMYLGQIMELAETEELFHHTLHPYSQALMSAVPRVDVDQKRERIHLTGEIPSPLNPPSGCSFHPRCPIARDACKAERPVLRDVGNGHWVACHLV
ncbi:MAG TPA: oligopeptide/dipeptide ABC transporter ATP-binding protein [Symbiobacteriaceae bacterium]|nr:oligopeptide/dipeptide ABC transporter ATP-binding protein [Symbiobacteriaceae bacterium]